METQKVILPFFYALFLPEFSPTDNSESLFPKKDTEPFTSIHTLSQEELEEE